MTTTSRISRTKFIKRVATDLVNDPNAAAIAIENYDLWTEQNWLLYPGWDDKAPEVFVDRRGAYWDIRDDELTDHLYRLKNGVDVLYVSEPYGPDAKAVSDFIFLSHELWHLQIGQFPLWYPSRTVQLIFSRLS
jgi:hypothetical protein